jgi:hypothetical protein
MRSFLLLWSAILRMAKQTMSTWRAVVVGMMLCLMVVAGCDVRPFSELFGHDSEEENDTGSGGGTDDGGTDDDETDDGETPDSTELELTATPPEIEIPENTQQTTVQVTINNPTSGRMHTFSIATPPDNGTAGIDNNGLLTFTPETGFDGSDDLVVRVTDDGSPARSGDITITITVNPGPP